jgi:PAS domain S-box-containing protein
VSTFQSPEKPRAPADAHDRAVASSLPETARHLDAILEATSTVIYLMTPDSRFIRVNRRFEMLFGVQDSEIRGRSVYDVFPREIADAFVANNEHVLAVGGTCDFEELAPHADGQHVYVSVKTPVSDATGRPVAIVGVSTDVTERKRVEAEREALLAHTKQLAAQLGVERQTAESLVAVSRTLTRSLDADEVVQQVADTVGVLLRCRASVVCQRDASGSLRVVAASGELDPGWHPGSTIPPTADLFARALEEGRPGTSTTCPASTESPSEKAAAGRPTVVAPLVIHGRTLGIIGLEGEPGREFTSADIALLQAFAGSAAIALDNARRYRLEQATRGEVEAANRTKDEFLAMLGHELRHPLAAIGNAIHILERLGPTEERAAQAVQIITRQQRHLTRLTDELLEAARAATGKIVLSVRPVELGEVTRRCVAEMTPTNALDLEVDVQTAWVQGDETRLIEIISNLVGNAFKYTPPGGRVIVRVTAEEDETVLRVEDSGAGIDAVSLSRLFEPFVQGHPARDRVLGGLGLGLALVRRLVQLHGGTVTAASPGPGLGSTFTVRLPRIVAPSPSVAPVTSSTTPVTRRRILVVEHHDDSREALRTLLGLDGHEVDCAGGGPAALQAAIRRPPDVALIDIGLAVDEGYELARRIRSAGIGIRTRLIALADSGSDEARRHAIAFGFDDVLVKPVEPQGLARVLATHGGTEGPDAADPPGDDERLATVSVLTRLIASGGDVYKVCAAIAESAVGLLRARVARVWVHDPASQMLTACGSFGVDREATQELLESTALSRGRGIPGHVLHVNAPAYIADASDDPRWVNRRFIKAIGVRAYAGLPLVAGDRVLGVLSVMFNEARHFTEQDKATLELLADQAAIALQHARLLEAERRAHPEP